MPYIKSIHIPKKVYHFTKKENYESIIRDGKIIAYDGRESWFCLTISDMIQYIKLTICNEGGKYISSDKKLKEYPKFIPEDYIVLELKPRYSKDNWYYYIDNLIPEDFNFRLASLSLSKIKIGYRGDLEFKGRPKVYEMTEILKNAEIKS